MKALTIHQPWAWLVANGYKDVENRDWGLSEDLLPLRLYVHAGKSTMTARDPFIGRVIAGILEPAAYERMQDSKPFYFGAVIGEVTVTACVRRSDSPWFFGKVGWELKDAIAYTRPIPLSGRLGLFTVTPEQLEEGRRLQESNQRRFTL